MILLGRIIALLGLLKVVASLLRRGQGRHGGVAVIPEIEVLILHLLLLLFWDEN